MPGPIRKNDLFDLDVVDAYELRSDGLASTPASVYLTTTGISTTSGTQTIVSSLGPDGEGLLTSNDHPVQAGDFVYLTGSTGADGKYTVASIPTDTSVVVVEVITTSTGGTLTWVYPRGAGEVGLDPTGLAHVVSNNVQDAIVELDAAVGTGSGITASQHEVLRQLIHLADGIGGPFEGFLTGAYRVSTGSPFPTGIIWYDDNTLAKKIVEKTITYNPSVLPTVVDWKVYNTDGTTLIAQATDTITYSGAFETSRTRTIVDYGIGTSFLTVDTHKTVRQLIHLADGIGGPFEGFATNAYRESLYTGYQATSITWYEDITKVKKIVERTVTYNGNQTQNTSQWKVYDTDGVTVLATVTDTMTFSSFFETSRTRAIV